MIDARAFTAPQVLVVLYAQARKTSRFDCVAISLPFAQALLAAKGTAVARVLTRHIPVDLGSTLFDETAYDAANGAGAAARAVASLLAPAARPALKPLAARRPPPPPRGLPPAVRQQAGSRSRRRA